MDDLVTWLRAQLDADERRAERIASAEYFHGVDSDVESDILAVADPARLRAEVHAKRRVVAEYERLLLRDPLRTGDYWDGARDALRSSVLALTLPYGDRAGFNPQWAIAAVS